MKGLITNTKTGDLLVGRNRQATITDCEEQICESVLLAMRGEFKEFPLLGAEVRQQLGGCVDPFWPQETKKCCAPARWPPKRSSCKRTAP